ncbi:DUF2894 domain-containing protein [Bordetella petrii]|uniref:DUF2894 domain-containing protein n=1 Tax=Bordetella petrii TaxID=94624 RepID=A0ABT7W4R9_9BORD|nr:DUF2894 domain-containing protein [Bordetella petrii]MDM9560155.1 DUF2894 domain-containing protein [Bordetella petrii]
MNSADPRDAQATLDAWRERGADRLDPARFHFIAALARRAAAHDGEARRLLDERLAGLLQAYGEAVERAAGRDAAGRAAGPAAPAGPLAELLRQFARGGQAGGAAPDGAYPELAALDYFRETWARLSTDRQLRQSEAQVPHNAGPLNSNHLVHRALSLMHELSPAYVRQFLAYLDALAWLDQLQAATSAPAAPAAARPRKTGGRGRSQ